MCGIAGILYLNGQHTVESSLLRSMTEAIVHRGPDDEGFFMDGPVGLGVRRLSIVDVAGGHQPLSNEDGTVWIAYNGEAYNHAEVRQKLESKGHVFRTRSDTETIVHAYEEYGPEMVNHFRGMFAFAIWDKTKRRLLLYRDRLGIKPLYYCRIGDVLLFGSEIKSLLAAGLQFEVDSELLGCFLRLGYVPGERTLFRNVRKLLPGHMLAATIGDAGFSTREYWNINFAPRERSEPELLQELELLLAETIEQHRIGEVPQGTFLSGGVDSSYVVAVTAQQVQEPILTFSIGYPNRSSELPQARWVANQFHTMHSEYELNEAVFADSLPRLAWHMDEPIADPAAIPLFFIAQHARESITVVQSGEGADEIFAGYGLYQKMQSIAKLRRVLGGPASGLVGGLARTLPMSKRFKRGAKLLNLPFEQAYRGIRTVFSDDEAAEFLIDDPAAAGNDYLFEVLSSTHARTAANDDLSRMLAFDLKTWLPDDLLIKADKMTMAASIELRVPFLDHKVVEFAATIPSGYKLKSGQSKYVLKQLLRKYLPPSFVDAPKRGFPVPVSDWLRGTMYSAARSWLLDSTLLGSMMRRDKLDQLLSSHNAKTCDAGSEIYGLMCLAIWYDVFTSRTVPLQAGACLSR